MSLSSEIWNLSALCRCCHTDGHFKNLGKLYTYKNGVEIYSKMLLDTLNVEICPPPIEASYSICEECIVRLRDANKFKKQVVECEVKFEEYCKNELALASCNEAVKIEDESADDDELALQVKMEVESADNGHDYDGAPDDDTSITNKIELEIEVAKTEDDLKAEKDGSKDWSKNEIKIEEDKSQLGIKKEEDAKPKVSGAKNKKVRKKPTTGTVKKKTTYDSSLEVHVKTDTGTLYSCKICQGSYTKHNDIKRHIKLEHTVKALSKCELCDKVFANKYIKHKHMSLHKKTHTCTICGKAYTTRNTLQDHLNIHNNTVYKCDLCSKEFKYKTTLKVHIKKHMGLLKKLICHECGGRFNDMSNLRIHVDTVHKKLRPFACDLCPKTFTAKKHLVIHVRKHVGDKPFECTACKKSFYSNFERNNHSCGENGSRKKYTCKVCAEVFYERGAFSKHVRRSHAGQKPYTCSVCGKDFTCKYSMKRHEILHTGVKPFSCDHCPQKFTQKTILNRHIARLHSGPKTLRLEQCELCNKSVVDLKQHLKCHNDRRFVCTLCDKSYSLASALNRHKKSTHFGFAVQCDLCPKRYVSVKSLKRHKLKSHKMQFKSEDFENSVPEYTIYNLKDGDGKVEPIDDD